MDPKAFSDAIRAGGHYARGYNQRKPFKQKQAVPAPYDLRVREVKIIIVQHRLPLFLALCSLQFFGSRFCFTSYSFYFLRFLFLILFSLPAVSIPVLVVSRTISSLPKQRKQQRHHPQRNPAQQQTQSPPYLRLHRLKLLLRLLPHVVLLQPPGQD